jgi:peptidoglycan/LPS O-acetylase OafA/YrhL
LIERADSYKPRADEDNFDVLRLLASWCVLFSHCYALAGVSAAEPFLSAVGLDTLGGLGVSVFFVLSGYLVTGSWLREPSVIPFALKRMRRIYPALIVCVLLTLLVLGPSVTTLDLRAYAQDPLSRQYLWTATGWDIRFVLPGVFASTPLRDAVNGSLWSLRYELLCYISLVGLAVLPFSVRAKALFVAISLMFLSIIRPPFNMWDFGFEFLSMGAHTTKVCLLFAIGACARAWRGVIEPRMLYALIALVVLAGVIWLKAHAAIRTEALYLVTLAILIVCVATKLRGLPRLPAGMGDWSYGMYLYAFPVQQTLAQLRVHERFGFAFYVFACTLITSIFAALSWFYVERRWLNSARRRL